MQRYELIEGTSSKFWEIDVSGRELTVRFGRIGTSGQSKTKSFADAAAAQKEWEKLVKEKTGKGYALASTSSATLTAAPPAPEPAQKAEAIPVSELTPAHRHAASEPKTQPLQLSWPTGGFQWKDEWRQALPVARGIHVPRCEALKASVASEFSPFQDSKYGFETEQLASVSKALGKQWTYWGADSTAHVTDQSLAQPDPDFWLELMAQASCSWREHQISRAVQTCAALHGLPFCLEITLQLWQGMVNSTRPYHASEMFQVLRGAIAAADEMAYQEVLQSAEALRHQSPEAMLACAHVFPHLSHWAEEAFASGSPDPNHFLRDCTLSPASYAAYVRAHPLWMGVLRPGLLLQIHLYGEAAFGALKGILQQSLGNKDATQDALELVLRMRVPELVSLLVQRMDNKEVRAALDKIAQEYPAAVLSCAIQHALETRERSVEGWTVRLALRKGEALAAALASLDEAQRTRFENILATLQREDAPADKLPTLLREPPWLRKAKQEALPVLDVAARPLPERLEWDAQEIARASQYTLPQYLRNMPAGHRFPQRLNLKPEGVQRLLQGQPLEPGDVGAPNYNTASPDLVLASPKENQLLLWNSYPATQWSLWNFEDAIRALFAQHGIAALPGLLHLVQVAPEKGLPLAAGIDTTRLVEPMLRAFRNLKKSRQTAEKWMRAHPRTALIEAMPQAFREGASASRDDARHAIRWLAEHGFESLVREIAQDYGADMVRAVDALLALDPLLSLPAKMPRLPSFFVAAAFRRPELADDSALPLAAIEHLGTMLQISRLDAPYAGLAIVKEHCTAESLAEFAWDLFEAWLTAGAPSKEGWAFTALGLLGNDETARRLAPRIREWPGEAAHARAVTGLDLLAAIGSDVALMHLNGIAGKVKFKGLQERARDKIAAVAQARGFTPEELADRLVPDLGLDANGTTELDFGPRKFYVGFDESLKPFVRDSDGARLKDLPKPNRSDDAALAQAATDRYKQMKKDAKAISSLQLIRLEMGMVARRRWSAQDFRLFFLEHPLMRHLAARLVWGVYEDGKLMENFRVAEDWTLADAKDEHYELPVEAEVGISHVMEIPKETLEAFGQIFADYEIQQPFRQLGRETYSLTPEELRQSAISRFANKVVATGSVMGLVNRGWERGQAQDAGWVGEFCKPVTDELEVEVQLDPGTIVGDLSYEPRQKLPEVRVRKRGTYDNNGLLPFDRLDPILVSEVLRDLDMLAPVAEESTP